MFSFVSPHFTEFLSYNSTYIIVSVAYHMYFILSINILYSVTFTVRIFYAILLIIYGGLYCMAYKNTLITGITDLLVLTILKNKGDCYAYEISKYITNKSNELLSISPNTIYTVMYKLENEHMISEYSVLAGKKRTRIYYHIESAGETYLEELQHDYENMVSGMSAIFDSLKKGDKHESLV